MNPQVIRGLAGGAMRKCEPLLDGPPVVEAVAVHVLGRPFALARRDEVPPVRLEADPALELVPVAAGLEVDLRRRRDQRRRHPPRLLLLHPPLPPHRTVRPFPQTKRSWFLPRTFPSARRNPSDRQPLLVPLASIDSTGARTEEEGREVGGESLGVGGE